MIGKTNATITSGGSSEDKLSYVVNDDTEYELTANDTQNWTSIRTYAFYHSTKLTSLVANNVTNIGSYAFQTCTGLTNISLPSVTSTSSSLFKGCTSLTTVN